MSTKEFYSMQDAHILCHADSFEETGLPNNESMSALPGLPLEPAMTDLLALLLSEQQQTERPLYLSDISLHDAYDPDDDDEEYDGDDDDEDDDLDGDDDDDDMDDDEDDDFDGDDDDDDEPYEEESDDDDM